MCCIKDIKCNEQQPQISWFSHRGLISAACTLVLSLCTCSDVWFAVIKPGEFHMVRIGSSLVRIVACSPVTISCGLVLALLNISAIARVISRW